MKYIEKNSVAFNPILVLLWTRQNHECPAGRRAKNNG